MLRRWAKYYLPLALVVHPTVAQTERSPDQLLAEADRLAWLRAWAKAEPLFVAAEKEFAVRGDHRNALYAGIGRLRGELPRRSIAEVSEQLNAYLEDPVVKSDDRLLLRCLTVKGDADMDYDPDLADRDWSQALNVAKRIGDAAWENRANGELGLTAALKGDTSTGIVRLGNALKTAQANGDLSSQVRWLSILGQGYVEFGRSEPALSYFDRAFQAAAKNKDLEYPLMACSGKAEALAKLDRLKDANELIVQGLEVARSEGRLGYQSDLLKSSALIDSSRGNRDAAIAKLQQAASLAKQADAGRLLAEIDLELAKLQRAAGHKAEAEQNAREGVETARAMRERLLTPRLLTLYAEIEAEQGRLEEAAARLDEAADVVEGLLVGVTSPWLKPRLIRVMNEVYVARIRLEGEHARRPATMFTFIEQARGRVLADLLGGRPMWSVQPESAMSAGERRLAKLQSTLWAPAGTASRKVTLNQIFLLETEMAPASTEFFRRSQTTGPHRPMALAEFRRSLRPDEVVLEFALLEPGSYCLVITRESARVRQLPSRSQIAKLAAAVQSSLRASQPVDAAANSIGTALLAGIPELAKKNRLIIVPDGELHTVAFELLRIDNSRTLLQSHLVSYSPSATVLALLRRRHAPNHTSLALAVSASPEKVLAQKASYQTTLTRGVYDRDASSLQPLQAASDEARSVVKALQSPTSRLLLGDQATEDEVKRQTLSDFAVLHFAVHGLISSKFPERSALVLRYDPNSSEDGFLQAREILTLRLNADLVTLSACESGSGAAFGQEGVSSLVRPFLAAGARAVVANLWAADDTFSLALIREFYRNLAAGQDMTSALRQAKLTLIEREGPEALPRLWSGLVLYGDGSGPIRGVPPTR